MAEDQVTQPEETTKEGQAPNAESGETPKRKKINRLSPDVLSKKIDEMEKANQVHSRYYQHLIQRKNEMQVQ